MKLTKCPPQEDASLNIAMECGLFSSHYKFSYILNVVCHSSSNYLISNQQLTNLRERERERDAQLSYVYLVNACNYEVSC